jgi:glycosyltransferase involved in cell wall biosynthesis
MKVVYVATVNIPSRTASSVHVMKMCQAMVRHGFSVELIIPEFQPSSIPPNTDLGDFYGIKDRFPMSRLSTTAMVRGNDFYVRLLFHLFRQKPDLIYTRDIKAALVGSSGGWETIYEAHAPSDGKLGSFCFSRFFKQKKSVGMVAISEALKGILRQDIPVERNRGIPLVVAHDGVDSESISNLLDPREARERLGIEERKFVAGYTGHLYKGRGIEILIEMAQALPDVLFLIVGGLQKDIDYYGEQARDLGNFHLCGFVPNAEIPLYLASADVLLMPYQKKVMVSSGAVSTAEWMSPMKMFEYMGAKRPIIASDLPVLREVLKHEGNALLTEPADSQGWIRQLQRLREDPGLGRKIGLKAWEEVASHYTWEKRVQGIFSYFGISLPH